MKIEHSVADTVKALAIWGVFLASLIFILPINSIMPDGRFASWFIGYMTMAGFSFFFIYMLAVFKNKSYIDPEGYYEG